jgi:hypothetical protein
VQLYHTIVLDIITITLSYYSTRLNYNQHDQLDSIFFTLVQGIIDFDNINININIIII